MDNWVSVFTTNEEFEAERIKELLSDSNIPAVILNQKDSSYIMLGEVNVMVNKEHKEEAKKVIKNKNDRE